MLCISQMEPRFNTVETLVDSIHSDGMLSQRHVNLSNRLLHPANPRFKLGHLGGQPVNFGVNATQAAQDYVLWFF